MRSLDYLALQCSTGEYFAELRQLFREVRDDSMKEGMLGSRSASAIALVSCAMVDVYVTYRRSVFYTPPLEERILRRD